MSDVNISKYRAQVIRTGSTPASPGFVVSEGQNPVDPSGSGQTHLPVTIATASTGLSITESQILSGAGLVSQYIRGDGSLADFPATTGGGSSVSYYLNGSVSQGTIGGVAYKELNRTPIFGAGTDITINADGYIASFITDAGDPNKLLIPAGNWNFETYFSASSSGGSPSFYVELYKYNGTTFTLIASNSTAPELIAFGTNLNPYFSTLAVPETVLALTDRLALRYYVTHSGRTITLHTENGHLCEVITTFTTGLTALNGLTNQVQFFAVGTSGTDFAISSATDTHTFNLPTASATNRGALSSADWTTFNAKENAITAGTTAQYFRGDKTFQTLNTAAVPELTNLYYTEARVNANTNVTANTAARHNAVTLGTANGLSLSTQVLSLGLASAGVTGALSGTDWSTFNGKQNALTNPVTGTGTSGQVAYFTGTSAISSESNLFWDATNDRLGIGTNGPAAGLEIVTDSGTTNALRVVSNRAFNLNTDVAINFRYKYDSTNFTTGGLIVAAKDNNTSGSQSGNLQFYTNNAGSVGEQMRIFSDGNIFIGSSPSNAGFKLDVNGTGRIGGTNTYNGFLIGSHPNNVGAAITNKGNANATIYADNLSTVLNAETNLFLRTGNTDRLTLASTGAATFSSSVTANSSIISTTAFGGTFTTSDGTNQVRFGSYFNSIGTGNSYDGVIYTTSASGALYFLTGGSTTSKMLITSGGYTKSSNNGAYVNSTGAFHESNQNLNDGQIAVLRHSGNSSPIGLEIAFTGADPNNASNYMLGAYTTSGGFTWIYRIFSNGTVSARSDARWKKNIETTRSGYIDDLCKLRVVKYNWYNHQDDAPKELGLIAQEVEEVFPNLIQHDPVICKKQVEQKDGTLVEEEYQDGTSRSIKVSVLPYMLLKAIQEQQKQIEELKSKLS